MAMTLTNSRATFGLQSRFSPTNTNVFGPIQIGGNNETISFSDSDTIYSIQAFFSNAAESFVLDVSNGICFNVSTGWDPGQAQVESVNLNGVATANGDVTIIVTANGLNGSPKSIPVEINSGDTEDIWGGKVKTALSSDSDINSIFDVKQITNILKISGSLTAANSGPSIYFEDLNYNGIVNGKPSYKTFDSVCYWQSSSSAWVIYYYETNQSYAAWYSFQNVDSPELVTTWSPSTNEGGTPILDKISSKIHLTRKPLQTIDGSNISVPYYASNDSTLNIEIDAGTTGVASVATSTNLTSGLATSGCLVLDAEGLDIEGKPIETITTIDAALFKVIGGGVNIDDSTSFLSTINADGKCLLIKPSITNPIEISSIDAGSIQITILGTI